MLASALLQWGFLELLGASFPVEVGLQKPHISTGILSSEKPHNTIVNYCRRKELMACVRKPREKLCASAFHPSQTHKIRTRSGRRSRPLLVPFFRDLEGRNSLAHIFSRGFCNMLTNSIRRQYSCFTHYCPRTVKVSRPRPKKAVAKRQWPLAAVSSLA